MGRRWLLALVGWFAAAALATLVGLAAIRVISDGMTSGVGEAKDAAEVARALAEASAEPAAPSPGAPSVPPSASAAASGPSGRASEEPPNAVAPAPVIKTFRTSGGSVRAECTGPSVRLVSWTPAPGYATHEIERGARREAEAEFRAENGRVKIDVTCSAGVPTARIEVKD